MVKRGGKEAVQVRRPHLSRGITTGTELVCADNSGAKVIEMISVEGYRGRIRRYPRATLGNVITASVKVGNPEMRRQIVKAIVVRQRMPARRPDGMRLIFEDNAAVILTPDGDPKGTEVHGPVAKEAAERIVKLAGMAMMVV
ncbi:MAG: 50S ribosomal protein L14 [TACK group archaeon]|nr:50S ribosomal protein L14 [TACK group archaeon]